MESRAAAAARDGWGFTVVRRVPPRGLPEAPLLRADEEFRLRCVEHAQRQGVAEAVRVFGRSRATICHWRKRYDPDDLHSLRPCSRRPHRTRRRQWTAVEEAVVLAVRQRHPRSGKAKLRWLLKAEGIELAASRIGRILGSLKRRRLLIEPHAVRLRQRRAVRPYATRVPPDKRSPAEPGALIQLDTMHPRRTCGRCPASSGGSSRRSMWSRGVPWSGSGRPPRRGPPPRFWMS